MNCQMIKTRQQFLTWKNSVLLQSGLLIKICNLHDHKKRTLRINFNQYRTPQNSAQSNPEAQKNES